MKTVLFAPETFNLAETSRCLEIAKELKSEYECLFSGYSDKFSGIITEAGFEFQHLEPKMSETDCRKMMDFDQLKSVKRPLSHEQLLKRIDSEIELIKKRQVVLVVIGSTLTTFISARHCQVPLIYVKPYALSLAACQDTLRNNEANLVDKIAAYLWLKSPIIPFKMKKIAGFYGVKPAKKTCKLVEADLNLVTTLQALGGFQELPEDYDYIGPIYFRKIGDIPDVVLRAKANSQQKGRPLLYFAMGSSANKSVIIKLLDCLKDLELDVVAPVMFYLTLAELADYKDTSIVITDWLPADSVNQLADVALIHGGEGTVQTACASGKPFLGLGFQSEQRANIKSCVAYGNARELKMGQINVKSLNALLGTLLTESHYLKKAQSMAQLMSRTDGAKNGAKIIRDLIN